MGSSRGTVGAIEFALLWEKSRSVREVAAALGCKQATASTRAHEYRKKGIDLKMMRPEFTPHKIDVGLVNAAIDKLDGEV